ncbi:MAG: hypothetical protein R3A44_20460 [Caldilineaceae bacterium]
MWLLPLATHPLIQAYAPFYREWLTHHTADAHWQQSSVSAHYERIHVPALNISGWYGQHTWITDKRCQRNTIIVDDDLPHTLEMFVGGFADDSVWDCDGVKLRRTHKHRWPYFQIICTCTPKKSRSLRLASQAGPVDLAPIAPANSLICSILASSIDC